MFDDEKILEDEYNTWNKNIKMLADIASVEYGIKLGDSKFSINNSFRRVLDGLKDSDVYIDYMGNYLDEYSYIKSDIEDYIKDFPKYKKYFEKLLDYDLGKEIEIVQKNFVTRFNGDPIRMEKITIEEERDREYNLIELFVKYRRFDLLDRLLMMDVGKHKKRNIVKDVFKSLTNDNLYFSPLFEFIIQDEYRDIVKDYCESLLVDSKRNILENSPIRLSLELQKDELVNFNDKDILYTLPNNKKVAPVVKVLNNVKNINDINIFYNDSYLNYSEEVRKNTDNAVIDIVLNKYHSISHAKQVLNYKNFKIDEDIVDTITKYFLKNNVEKDVVEEVADIIINKSKNSDEYRENKKYANKLLINTDKEQLKELRTKLLQVFHNTIDSNLNMKIGDIKVYKKS